MHRVRISVLFGICQKSSARLMPLHDYFLTEGLNHLATKRVEETSSLPAAIESR